MSQTSVYKPHSCPELRENGNFDLFYNYSDKIIKRFLCGKSYNLNDRLYASIAAFILTPFSAKKSRGFAALNRQG